jgi:anti-sigma regulatory factor (Ser/Thr protein kinase)
MSQLWVRHSPKSAAIVRRSVMAALSDAGFEADAVLDGALIASELVGNAVRHGLPLAKGRLLVTLHVSQGEYRLYVTDGGAQNDVTPRRADRVDTAGRGLTIVAELAENWGVTHGSDGSTTVWANYVSVPVSRSLEPQVRSAGLPAAPSR